MFCPECGSEYRAGFGHCVDCDVDLVDRLPETRHVGADQGHAGPAVVFVTSDTYEAAVVKSLLEANGVKVCSFDENLSRIDSLWATAIGGIKLAVDASQEELAREVLTVYRGALGQNPTEGKITPFGSSEEGQAVGDETENGGTDERRCPRCDAIISAGATLCSNCGCDL